MRDFCERACALRAVGRGLVWVRGRRRPRAAVSPEEVLFGKRQQYRDDGLSAWPHQRLGPGVPLHRVGDVGKLESRRALQQKLRNHLPQAGAHTLSPLLQSCRCPPRRTPRTLTTLYRELELSPASSMPTLPMLAPGIIPWWTPSTLSTLGSSSGRPLASDSLWLLRCSCA